MCRRNCGFDVLLMAVGRAGADFAGTGHENRPIICMDGRITSPLDWRSNIDGLAMHEMAHIFGCQDYGAGHPNCDCIMFYNWRKNCIYEEIWIPFFPAPFQYPYWCSECQDFFNVNWCRFSIVSEGYA